MKIEYEKIGVVRDGSVYPQEIDHYITCKKIYYSDHNDFLNALKEMPDYECWDSDKKVLIKEEKLYGG